MIDKSNSQAGMTGVQMLIEDLQTKKITVEDLIIVKDMYLHTEKDLIEQAYRIGSVSVLDEDLYSQAARYYENNYGNKKLTDHLVDTNEKIDHIADVSKMVEDDIEKLAEIYTTELDWDTDDYEKNCARVSFKAGYNKAKEKYKWTNEDMRKAFMKGISITGEGYNAEYASGNSPDLETEFGNEADQYIQSIQQQNQQDL